MQRKEERYRRGTIYYKEPTKNKNFVGNHVPQDNFIRKIVMEQEKIKHGIIK